MIATVILAAGQSSRMGTSKALLRHIDGATTFVAHAIRASRQGGVPAIIVVGRAGDDELRLEAEREGATFVANPHPERGQLSSLLVGLDTAEREWGADAIAVAPVDVPMITPDVIARLVAAAASSPAPIVRAAAGGKHGHPVIFKRAVFDELRSADPDLGARSVVRRDPSRVLDVEVDDAVTLDVDTPDDYRRAFGRSV